MSKEQRIVLVVGAEYQTLVCAAYEANDEVDELADSLQSIQPYHNCNYDDMLFGEVIHSVSNYDTLDNWNEKYKKQIDEVKKRLDSYALPSIIKWETFITLQCF